jgi:hypothetical protein
MEKTIWDEIEDTNIISKLQKELHQRMDAGKLTDEERTKVLELDLQYQKLLDSNIFINGKPLTEIKEEQTVSFLSPIMNMIMEQQKRQLAEK